MIFLLLRDEAAAAAPPLANLIGTLHSDQHLRCRLQTSLEHSIASSSAV